MPAMSATYGIGSKGSGAAKAPGAGDRLWDGLKNVGKATLNTLSVPQAVLFTTGSKIGEAITGKKGMDWSDLAGGFSEGYKGFSEILEQAGVPKDSKLSKIGGLAGDVVLDPLWFVAPAKLAKTAGKADDVVKAVGAGATAARAVADGGKANAVRTLSKINRTPSGKQWQVTKHTMVVPKNAGNVGVSKVARDIGEAQGRLVNGKYFITQTKRAAKKKGSAPAEYRIYDLRGGVDELTDEAVRGQKAFRTPKQAEDWLKSKIDEMDNRPIRELEGRPIDLDPRTGLPTIESMEATGRASIKGAAKQFEKGDLGIKFGVGKPNPKGGKGLTGKNFTVRTPVPYPGATLGAISGMDKFASYVKRTPVEKAAHRLQQRGKEYGSMVDQVVEGWRGRTGMDEADSILTTFLGFADNVTPSNLVRQGEEAAGLPYGELADQLAELLKTGGKWTDEKTDVLRAMQDRFANNWESIGRGVDDSGRRYFPQAVTDESAEALREAGINPLFSGRTSSTPIQDRTRTFESGFAYYTRDEWKAILTERAGLDDKLADDLLDLTEMQLAEAAKLPMYDGKKVMWRDAQEAAENALGFEPELDAFKLFTKKERSDFSRRVDAEIDALFKEAGLGELVDVTNAQGKITGQEFRATPKGKNTEAQINKMRARTKRRANMRNIDGTLQSHPFTQKFQTFSAHFKMWLTSPNPQHYVNNAFGDWFNSLVRGNIRHWAPGKGNLGIAGKPGQSARKGSKYFRMATGDVDTLDKTFIKLGGQEYSGWEMLTLAHLMGLGRGFSGDEVAAFTKIMQESKNPVTMYMRWAQRQNMAREDAVRLEAWVRHMESGDSPVEAMYKMLDGIFDYGDLTDFEKNVLRNVIMFYTWMRKNTAFQVKAVAKKPGLYAAYGDIERDRPKMPFEPDYISEMGLIWIPGFGAVYTASPWADLYKIPLDPRDGNWGEAFRRNFLGALPPPFKQAIELSTNKDMFTGGDLRQFPGQLKQSNFPYLDAFANKFGIGAPARSQKDGPLNPAVPWWMAYASKQLGPFASTSGKLFGDKGPSMANPVDAFAQITGFPKRVQVDPVEAERQATIAAAKRKAEETRRKNQTARNPEYSR